MMIKSDMKEIMSSLEAFLSAVADGYKIDENTTKNAAMYGALDVLKWLNDNDKFNAGADICEIATIGAKDSVDEQKQIEVIKWLKTKKYIVDELTAIAAVKYNHFEILKLRNQKPNYKWGAAIFEAVIKYNRGEMITFVKDNISDSRNNWQCTYAAAIGNFKMLKLLHEEDYPMNSHACKNAAIIGNFEMLKWLHAEGCPWDTDICTNAAESGHIEMIKWLRAKGCSWDERTCLYAASSGHFELLKWLHAEGCPWDESSCAHAAVNAHFEILKWLHANGCPWDKRTTTAVVKYGKIDMLKWLCAEKCPLDSRAYTIAAENGQLAILKWLKIISQTRNDLLPPFNKAACELAATENHHTEIVEWLQKIEPDEKNKELEQSASNSEYICCFSNESMPTLFKICATKQSPKDLLNEANSDMWRPSKPYKSEFAKNVCNSEQKLEKVCNVLSLCSEQSMLENGFFSSSLDKIKDVFNLMDGDWTEE